jgi:serine/threonine protein kinase
MAVYECYEGDITQLYGVVIDPKDDRMLFEIMWKIAEALKKVSDQNLAHRDIKPGNILLRRTPDWEVAFCDLATLVDQNESREGVLGVAGTPFYYSPEFLRAYMESRNKNTYKQVLAAYASSPSFDFLNDDLRSLDLYALGVTFVSLLNMPVGWERATDARLQYIAQMSVLPERRPDELNQNGDNLRLHLLYIARQMIHPQPARRPTISQVVEQFGALKTS